MNGQKQQPIGFWLKRTDELLTKRSNEALSEVGLTRFHWQALNSIFEADTITRDDLFAGLQTFVDSSGLDAILDDLVSRGWLVRREGMSGAVKLELTDSGKEGHSQALARQAEVRRRSMQGISQEEYTMVIRILQRFVENLA